MASDLFATMRALARGPKNLSWLDAEDCKSLQSLGLVQVERSGFTDTQGRRTITASLTQAGRAKLHEVAMSGVKPSPVGSAASRSLSDTALLALADLHAGTPLNDLAAKALLANGLACETHGIYSLTQRGADLLFNAATQSRLAGLRNPYRRG